MSDMPERIRIESAILIDGKHTAIGRKFVIGAEIKPETAAMLVRHKLATETKNDGSADDADPDALVEPKAVEPKAAE